MLSGNSWQDIHFSILSRNRFDRRHHPRNWYCVIGTVPAVELNPWLKYVSRADHLTEIALAVPTSARNACAADGGVTFLS